MGFPPWHALFRLLQPRVSSSSAHSTDSHLWTKGKTSNDTLRPQDNLHNDQDDKQRWRTGVTPFDTSRVHPRQRRFWRAPPIYSTAFPVFQRRLHRSRPTSSASLTFIARGRILVSSLFSTRPSCPTTDLTGLRSTMSWDLTQRRLSRAVNSRLLFGQVVGSV